jgi:hypothetical protein
MREEVKVKFRKSVATVYHVTPRCELALFLHECFFEFVFHLSVMDGKIEQNVCNKFCMMLGTSTTKTFEMLHEPFEEYPLSRTAVF